MAKGPVAFFAVTDLFIVAGVVFDAASRRRVHPAYVWGGLLIVGSQNRAIGWVAYSGVDCVCEIVRQVNAGRPFRVTTIPRRNWSWSGLRLKSGPSCSPPARATREPLLRVKWVDAGARRHLSDAVHA
jgi:hypothetical protein